jgi:hypothetical protein
LGSGRVGCYVKSDLHEKVQQAEAAEGVSAVNHYPGNSIAQIKIFLAKQAGLLVDKVIHESLDLVFVRVGRVLRLLEEVGGWVLKRLHNLNIMDG